MADGWERHKQRQRDEYLNRLTADTAAALIALGVDRRHAQRCAAVGVALTQPTEVVSAPATKAPSVGNLERHKHA